ncbi:MAG: P-loop NTPase family protein [Planctomycetota bacterium]
MARRAKSRGNKSRSRIKSANKRKDASLARGSSTRSNDPGTGTDEDSKGQSKARTAVHAKKMRSEEDNREQHFRDLRRQIREIFIEKKGSAREFDLSEAYALSRVTLGDYVTLDWQHALEIEKLKIDLWNYAEDESRQRPLNIMMLAEPGSGKSHFIKCLTKELGTQVGSVIFNMTAMRDLDDLTMPLDKVRNLKVNDKLPLLFLDEFDSEESNYPILLPLLWDGELQVGHRDLKVGKAIIILAGSGAKIQRTIKASKGMREEISNGATKLADLLSRINGGELMIPGLEELDETRDRDRRADKVCISIALLSHRFRHKRLEAICWPLLSFIAKTKFRYEVRSIAHLIDRIPSDAIRDGMLRAKDLRLPLDKVEALKAHSLAYHIVAEDGPASVVSFWEKLQNKKDFFVKFERKVSRHRALGQRLFLPDT